MDHGRFDEVSQRLSAALRRRSVLGLIAGAPIGLATTYSVEEVAAKRRRVRGEHNIRGKKALMCIDGVTTRVAKRKRKKYLKQGATRGACAPAPDCTPVCPTDGSCGGSNGCGGVCGCAAGSFCDGGQCTVCDVACTGSAAECGAALSEALLTGGTIRLCPGTYGGQFVVTVSGTEIIGAGNGDDPATSSILDGQSGGTTISTPSLGFTTTLTNLRVTGGSAGGVYANFGTLNVTDCVVTGNTGGSGVSAVANLTMLRSEVTNNTADDSAGLYLNALSSETSTITDSRISGNTSTGSGSRAGGIVIQEPSATIVNTEISNNSGAACGGIYADGPGGPGNYSVTLDAGSSVTNNTATSGSPVAGGIVAVDYTVTVAAGADVSGNTNPQCSNVTGC